jgi:class 3 adenylate cyclase/DNA-binding response OmpR family regulator
MPLQVLIVQPDLRSAQNISSFFEARGDQVWCAADPTEAHSFAELNEPGLVVADLHLSDDGWQDVLRLIRRRSPDTEFLFTTYHPDPQGESRAQAQYGARAFLQQPVSHARLGRALRTLEEDSGATLRDVPRVRVPVRVKITLPYVLLALVLAMAASYLVSRVVLDTIEERFTNQLIEAGKLASDWMVNEENRLLETLRLVANTQGVSEAVVAGDAERLRELALPLAVNYQEEAIEILDSQGTGVLSLHHRSGSNIEDYAATRGETIFGGWTFVQDVLEQRVDQGRDKYAGLAHAPWGDTMYVAGPILDDEGKRVGVILVGKSLPTLVRQIRQDTLAHVSIYDLNGRPLASTFLFEEDVPPLVPELVSGVLERQDDSSLIRELSVASINYSEVVGPWEVRERVATLEASRSNNDLGLIGTSLAEAFLARPSRVTRLQVYALTAVAFSLVIAMGLYLAGRITRPLLQVVEASAEVTEGNLDVQVEATGNDEVAVLAHSFNRMVSGLREGSLYRDLLGRSVSPEVRDELRRSFASGDVRLEGQDAVATVLVSDIRGFTMLSETEDPTTILTWLNEYFDELVPIITAHGGVVNKFVGDSMLAFFGILPRPISPQESAYRACQAALGMLEAIERLSARRAARGDPPFTAGVGISTGLVTAGGLGSADRMHYTVIGDTVNTADRLEKFTREVGQESCVVISQHTLFALQDRRHELNLESLGVQTIRGKEEQLVVYRLRPAKVKV